MKCSLCPNQVFIPVDDANAGLDRNPEIEKPPHHVIVLNLNPRRQQAGVEGDDERTGSLNAAPAEFGE